jgi:hypothetical protein
MAEGSETYDGLAVPLFGESEIQQQTAATDIVTLTGAASQSGDFLVCQNSTGTENLVISSSGLVTSVVGMTLTTLTASAEATFSGLSSSSANGMTISVTSTGAMAANASVNANAILVQASSKSVINAVVMYDSVGGVTSAQVNTAVAFLGSNGTKAPTYFLTVGGTGGPGEGAATDNGFLDVARTINAAATKASYAGLKCLFGSKAYYILAVPDTNLV